MRTNDSGYIHCNLTISCMYLFIHRIQENLLHSKSLLRSVEAKPSMSIGLESTFQ